MVSSYSCKREDQPLDLKPYGDIAGTGVSCFEFSPPLSHDANGDATHFKVVIGFMGTAWLAVALIICHYFVAFDPCEGPFAESGNERIRGNPIDLMVIDLVRPMLKRFQRPRATADGTNRTDGRTPERAIITRWRHAFEKVEIPSASIRRRRVTDLISQSILTFCDIQVITGLGILVSTFIAVADGLSAYHYQIAVNLAWFSNLTHIAGLTMLRRYLHQRPLEKRLRWSSMAILAVMLLVALEPTIFFNWPNYGEKTASWYTYHAGCFFDTNRGLQWYGLPSCYCPSAAETCIGPNNEDLRFCLSLMDYPPYIGDSTAFQSVIVLMILLTLSFLSRTIKLFKPLQRRASDIRQWFTESYFSGGRFLAARKRRGLLKLLAKVFQSLGLSTLLFFRLYADVLTSTISDVSRPNKHNIQRIAALLHANQARFIGY